MFKNTVFNRTGKKNNTFLFRYIIIVFVFPFLTSPLSAQEKQELSKEEKKAMMRDTLDGKLDFSRFLIDANGFVPVPFIVTEPALGGFGLALVPVFIQSSKSKYATGKTPPNMTGAIGMYTANDSWLLGGFRLASIPKWSMKYRVALAYADINIAFYRDIPSAEDKEFDFNFVSKPVLLSLSKKITQQEIYLGAQYTFQQSKIKPLFSESLPESITEKELKSKTGSLGAFLDWDRRDNTFTPDHGAIVHVLYSVNDEWTGSDYTFERLDGNLNWFFPIKKNWISGIRAEVQHAFQSPPFYLLPFVSLRGVPTLRYQGQTTALVETEQRIDFNVRWSAVGFAGYGKAIGQDESFSDGTTVYNFGGGFRYLIARAFKVRAGIDIGFGPDSWGYYIVFGHNWNR
jgi:hypothetical protein